MPLVVFRTLTAEWSDYTTGLHKAVRQIVRTIPVSVFQTTLNQLTPSIEERRRFRTGGLPR